MTNDAMYENASDTTQFFLQFQKMVEKYQKTDFLAHFRKFSVYTLLQLMSYAPNFR